MQLALFLLFKLSHLDSQIYMPPLYERCEIQSITMSINQLYNWVCYFLEGKEFDFHVLHLFLFLTQNHKNKIQKTER